MKTRGQRILSSNCWAFCYINQYISLYKMKQSPQNRIPLSGFLYIIFVILYILFFYIIHALYLYYTFTLLILYIQFTYIIHYHSSHIKTRSV